MSASSSDRRRHLGVDFVIWRSESTWFWFLINPRGNGSMIGAAANEAQRSVRLAGRLKPY